MPAEVAACVALSPTCSTGDVGYVKSLVMKKFLFLLFLLAPFLTCIPDEDLPTPEPVLVKGIKPVYLTSTEATAVKSLPPQAIKRLGKIYYKDATIYVNEGNLGVHIIDNADPTNPVKKRFLQIPGCTDIAIKGNILYAGNSGDLIAVDISDLNNPRIVKRLSGILMGTGQQFPEFYEGWFECVEEGKGVVIGWEPAELTNPKCWR